MLLCLLFLLIGSSLADHFEVIPDGRWLTDPVSVTFKSELENAQFRYITNWKTLTKRPTKTTGTLWDGRPISISRNIILTVIHFNGTYYNQHEWLTNTYVFFSQFINEGEFRWKNNIDAAIKQIPLVSITSPNPVVVEANNAPQVPGAVEWIDPKDPNERFFYMGGLKFSGNYNVYLEKKSYRLYFSAKDWGGAGKVKEDLYAKQSGGPRDLVSRSPQRFENLQFRSGSADSIVWMEWPDRGTNYPGSYAQLLRNPFGDELQLAMGHWSAHSRFVHLLDNGLYMGVYHVRERLDSNYLADYVGGDKDDYEFNNHCVIRDGNGTLFDKLQATKHSYVAFGQWADIQNFIDYMIMQQFNLNTDVGPCWNWQGYGPYTGIIDGGFQFYGSDIDMGMMIPNAAIWESGPFDAWSSLWRERHADFVQLFHDRLYTHFNLDGQLTPAKMQALYRKLMAMIDPAIDAEVARWGAHTVNQRFTKQRWLAGNQWILNEWLSGKQTTTFFAAMNSKNRMYPAPAPLFAPLQGKLEHGQTVTITNQWPGSTLYCTTNERDPRLPGGSLGGYTFSGSSSASWTPKESGMLICRSRNAQGLWSPIQKRIFFLRNPLLTDGNKIQVTEVSYDQFDETYVEWIEIKNLHNAPINLLGCIFENDRTKWQWIEKAVIQPGGFLVGTNQRAQFRKVYKQQADFFYTGNFAKNADLKILDPWDETIVSVSWKDEAPWPELALTGYTLVPGYAFNPLFSTKAKRGRDWRFSNVKRGSPWKDDPTPITLTSFDQGNDYIVVNEAMLNPTKGDRWVEFKNTGPAAINVGSLYVTEHVDKPTKYKFKTGTVIPAGGYLVLDETALGFKVNDGTLYIMNPGKDYAINLPNKALKGYAQGRIRTSDGREHFAHVIAATPNAANAVPYIPNVVISAFGWGIPSEYEKFRYVKLTNVGTKSVVMTDWTVVIGDVEYKFVKKGIHDVVLLPRQSVYLLSNAITITAFKKAFASQWLDPTSIILNVLKIKDKEFYDMIKLQQPDGKDEVTVDRIDVTTFDLPKKRAGGPIQLTRVLPATFAQDPKSWSQQTLPAPPPKDCEYGGWTLWSPCTLNSQWRSQPLTEALFGGKPCNDLIAKEVRACANQVDCYWKEWSEWTACSTTCGMGRKGRTREQVAPQNGGRLCEGSPSIAAPCVIVECPIDCEWHEWGMWSDCQMGGVKCGSGVRERSRESQPEQFGGLACEGAGVDMDLCEIPCPVVEIPVASPPEEEAEYVAGSSLALVGVFVLFIVLLAVLVVVVIYFAVKSYKGGSSSTGGYQAY